MHLPLDEHNLSLKGILTRLSKKFKYNRVRKRGENRAITLSPEVQHDTASPMIPA